MSSCCFPNCDQTTNLSTISTEKGIFAFRGYSGLKVFLEPALIRVNVCHNHLECDLNMQKMRDALVLGRFRHQRGNSVNYNDLTLEKIVSTWKRTNGSKCSAFDCNEDQNLWYCSTTHRMVDGVGRKYFSPIRKILCDAHFKRDRFGEEEMLKDLFDIPKVSRKFDPKESPGPGLTTIEDTWK